MTGRGSRLVEPFGLALLALAVPATLLRFHVAEHRSPWFDEVALWMHAVSDYAGSVDGPVAIGLTRAALLLHGDWDAMHWAPALLGGLACIPVGWLGFHLSGERPVGLLAAALYACSALSVELSAQARPYAIFLFFQALALSAFARALAEESPRRWSSFALWTAVAVNTHLLGLVTPAGLVAGLLAAALFGWGKPSRATRLGLVLTLLVAVVSVATWFPFRPAGGERAGLPPELLAWLGQSLAAWVTPVQARTPDYPAALLCIALLGLSWIAAWRGRRRLVLCLVAAALAAQAVTAFEIGHKARWTLAERYVAHGLIPFLVVVAWLLLSRQLEPLRRTRRVAAALALIACVARLPALTHRTSDHDRDDAMMVETHVFASSRPDLAGIVVDSDRTAAHLRLVGPPPAPVFVSRRALRAVRYVQGLAGPPAVPRLAEANLEPGLYLLVGQAGGPVPPCGEWGPRLGFDARPLPAPVGELCELTRRDKE